MDQSDLMSVIHNDCTDRGASPLLMSCNRVHFLLPNVSSASLPTKVLKFWNLFKGSGVGGISLVMGV